MCNQGMVVGGYAPDFELPGVDGAVHHLRRYLSSHRAIAVVFMCNHCPYVRLYLERLKQIQSAFAEQGVVLIGINANDDVQYPDDSYENMKQFAAQYQLNFPYLRDVTQDVAEAFGAEQTPQVFLLDGDGVVRYCGAVDDNAQDAERVTQRYLQDAIAHLLAGTDLEQTTTSTVGCSIKWKPEI